MAKLLARENWMPGRGGPVCVRPTFTRFTGTRPLGPTCCAFRIPDLCIVLVRSLSESVGNGFREPCNSFSEDLFFGEKTENHVRTIEEVVKVTWVHCDIALGEKL